MIPSFPNLSRFNNNDAIFDDYIKILREECGEHLPETEIKALEPLLGSGIKDAKFIFVKLEELHVAGRVPSQRFAKTLTDFFWRFVY